MEIISRDTYIDHIIGFLDKGLMIALTGQRRVGKSFILRELAEVINRRNPSANIIYINKEKKNFSEIKTDSDLNEYLVDKLSDDKAN